MRGAAETAAGVTGPHPAPSGPPADPGAGPKGRAGSASRSRGARGGPRGGPRSPCSRRKRGANLPYLAVLAAGAAGLALMWRGGPQQARGGTLAVAGAMFVAALARLVLPEDRAGMLASRGRLMDVVTLAALAAGLLVAGLVLPTPS